jgi:adenylylsulfate kinase
MVIWIIGLSGSGKTTMANELVNRLRPKLGPLVHLDGDVLRDVWGDKPAHDLAGRALNAHRISHLCAMLDRQDIHVVASVLSIFPDWQRWNRANCRRYFEVYLDVPMHVLEQRDSKGLYRAGREGRTTNVVGVDIPFPPPAGPDLILRAPEVLAPPAQLVNVLMQRLPADFLA